MPSLTMQDIARLSGVSRQTVSAILNGKQWVSEKTRNHVLGIIEQYDYTPNRQAMSLAGNRTRLVGVLLRDITNPFYTQLAAGIETVARAHSYGLLYYNTHEDHDSEAEAIRELIGFNVEGIIIAPVLVGVDLDHLWRASRLGKPLVSIDRIPGLRCDCVEFDNTPAAYQATKYLIDNGHRRIGFLGGPQTSSSAQQRFDAFRTCLLDHNIRLRKDWVIGAGATPEQRYEASLQLLRRPASDRPTAVFCFNDLVAISAYKTAHELWLRIPEDVSLLGFDDIDMAALMGPPLTTVRLDSRKAGEEAARILIERLEDTDKEKDNRPPRQILITPQLIIRGSVRKIPE